jgi:hypothetical protein
MTLRRVGGMRKHPHGRVDQLEDRYLGMVEAPSSNLGTSTRNELKHVCWTCATNLQRNISVKFVGSARPLLFLLKNINGVDCAATNVQRSILVKSVGSARPPHSMTKGRPSLKTPEAGGFTRALKVLPGGFTRTLKVLHEGFARTLEVLHEGFTRTLRFYPKEYNSKQIHVT